MTKSHSGKSCAFFKCSDQADVLVTFSGVESLGACSFYLCKRHSITPPFNFKADIASEKDLHEVKDNV